MAKLNLLTTRQVRNLVRQAKDGDEQAERQLRVYNRRISSQANTRLSRLEKADLDYYAYDRATSFTKQEYNSSRFSTDKAKLSNLDDLYAQIVEVETFLKAPTSTVSGQKSIIDARISYFREQGVNIPKGSEREFIDFIASETFQELKENYVASDQLIDDFGQLFEKGVSLESVEREFSKVLSANDPITYDVALENLGIEL